MPACSLGGLQKLCASLPAADQPWAQLPGGTLLPNPKFTGTAPSLTAEQKAQSRKAIEAQFELTRTQMMDEIKGSSSESQFSDGQKQWLERIKNLKLKIDPLECESETSLSGGHMDSPQQTIMICETAGLTSGAHLAWLLGHEMGHTIDGCNSQLPYFRKNGYLPLPSGTHLSEGAQKMYDAFQSSSFFSTDTATYEEIINELAPYLADWQRRGLVTKLQNGITPEQYPLSPVLNCLRDHGILTPATATVSTGTTGRRTSVSETTADFWGAKIAGKYLSGHAPQSDLEKLAVLQPNTVNVMCGRALKKPSSDPTLTWKVDDPRWWQIRLPTKGRYIDDRFRDEATLLTEPAVQKAMGCTPDPSHGNCMTKFPDALKSLGLVELPPVEPLQTPVR